MGVRGIHPWGASGLSPTILRSGRPELSRCCQARSEPAPCLSFPSLEGSLQQEGPPAFPPLALHRRCPHPLFLSPPGREEWSLLGGGCPSHHGALQSGGGRVGATPEVEPGAGVTAAAPREVPGARGAAPGERVGTDRRTVEPGATAPRPCALLCCCCLAPSALGVVGKSWGQPVPSWGGSCNPPSTAQRCRSRSGANAGAALGLCRLRSPGESVPGAGSCHSRCFPACHTPSDKDRRAGAAMAWEHPAGGEQILPGSPPPVSVAWVPSSSLCKRCCERGGRDEPGHGGTGVTPLPRHHPGRAAPCGDERLERAPSSRAAPERGCCLELKSQLKRNG